MRRQAEWIYRAPTDLLISLCWIPLFLLGHVLSSGVGINADDRVRWAVAAVLVFSFLHQPLTFALVYGDRKQFDQRRRLFLWAPPITVGVIALAVTQHLWVVIPSAALWNTVHTLQQRYGLSRIYARRSGYGSAFLDRSVLYAWMAAAVLVVAGESRTLGLVRRVSLGGVNGAGVRLLTDARPVAWWLLVPVGAAALALAAVALVAFGVASRFHGDAGNVVLFSVGALHFLYDGFIWKLRKPAVAADFAIRS